MRPPAKSFILDLLSTLRRGTMPVSALVEAGELFGIASNSTRVALVRLLADGHVARDERGRYRLGAGAQPVERRVTRWRESEQQTRRWAGGWLGVHVDGSAAAVSGSPARQERRGRDRALRLVGFRSLTPGLAIRPDNLKRGIDAVRDELRSLGLPGCDLVFELRAMDPATDQRARSLWDVSGLRATYRNLGAELEKSGRQLERFPVEEAMVESFLLGGRALRQLVLDPLLPEAICPGAEREALRTTMRQYDRLGRAAWSQFLKRYDVPHLSTPADTRMTTGLDGLSEVAGLIH